MKKVIKIALSFLAFLLILPTIAFALSISQPVQGGTGSSTLSGILIGAGTAPVKTLTIGTNLTLVGTTLSATGGGSTFAWIPQTWGNSTSTTLGFPGFISSASSTISASTTIVGNLTLGNGLFASGLIPCNGTSFLQWSAGLFGCATPAGGTGFSTTSADYYITSTTTLPSITTLASLATVKTTLTGFLKASSGALSTALIDLTADVTGTLPYTKGGTGTTTAPQGQLLYGGATAYQSVATSSASCSSGVSCSAFTVVGSVSPSITNSGVTSNVAGNGISLSGSTGAVTITNAIGYPFIGNSTSTLLSFTGGFLSTASSTINASTTIVGNLTLGGNLFGAGLIPCVGSTFLQWTGGTFSCGTPAGGSGGGTWSTTTSQVAGQLINYPNNNTDIVSIGSNATSTAKFVFDPNLVQAFFGIGGTGSSTIQFGPTGNQWIMGYSGADKSFSIASSTFLGVSPALTINKATLVTSLAGGLVSIGSSTINGNATTTGTHYATIASSTSLYGAGLFGCNSASNALTWSAGVFGCNTISGGSSTFGTSSLTALWPIIYTQSSSLAQFSFGGLSTSTAAVLGNIPYFSGVNTFANVATGTVTGGSGITVNAGQSVIGSGLTITNSIGYPFIGNSTSTLLSFTSGLLSVGSTTINGNATTTGTHFASIASSSQLYGAGLFGCNSASSALTWNAGVFGCNSISSGGTFPFTPTSYGNSTSSVIGFLAGLISNGSTTVSSLSSGLVGNNNGLLYSFASSSLFGYTPLNPTRNINTTFPLSGGGDLSADRTLTSLFSTTSNSGMSQGSLYIGSGGIFQSSASSSIFGYTPEQVLTFGTPNVRTGNTVNWVGLATTSQPASSNLLTSNGAAGVYGTATSTLTASGPLTGSFTQVGSGGSLGCTTAASGVAGCLSNTSFDTFNNKAGFGWPWVTTSVYGTTTRATTTPEWFQTGLFASSTSQIAYASTTMFSFVTASTTNLVVNVPSALLVTNAAGNVAAFPTNSCGANTYANTISALGVLGCASITNASLVGSGVINATYTGMVSGSASAALGGTFAFTSPSWPWLTTTNYATTTNATTTQSWFVQGLTASSTSYFVQANLGTASTTALTVSGTPNCSGSSALTTNAAGVVACGSITGSGGTFPFLPAVYGTQNVNATTTGIWLTSAATPYGVIASTTFTTYASTTQLSASDKVWLTNTKNGPLGTDVNGLVSASTTGAITAGTGISLDSSVRQVFGGSLAITNSGVTSAVAGAGIAVSGATGAVTFTNSYGYPFVGSTSFGVNPTNSTSTLLLLTGGLSASSTVRFGNAGASSQFTWDSIVGTLALGTSTVLGNSGTLTVGTSSAPQIILGDNSGVNALTFIRNISGNLFIGTSTAATGATSTLSALTIMGSTGNTAIASSSPWAKFGVEFNLNNPAFVVSHQGSSTPSLFVGGVNQNGFVGIGTSTSDALGHSLQINANLMGGLLVTTWTNIVNAFTIKNGSGTTVYNVDTTSTFPIHAIGTSSGAVAQLDVVGLFGTPPINNRFFEIASSSISATSSLFLVNNIGQVGISSSTPWSFLSVNPTSALNTNAMFSVGSSSATALTVNNGGLVGIGTSSPFALFSISPLSYNTTIPSFFIGSTTSGLNATFIVDKSGLVGIGTTSPFANLSIFLASTTLTTLTAFNISSTSAGTATTSIFLITNGGAIFAPKTLSSGSSQTGYWCYDANGQFIRDTAVCIVSALKFKKDIKPLDVGLSELMQLKSVSYFKKEPLGAEDSHRQMGFIADDVAKISPALNEMLVTYVGGGTSGEVHALRYEQLTSLIVKSVQELNTKVENLKLGHIVVETKRSAEENWQDILIGLLVLGFLYQQWQLRKLHEN